MKSILIVLAAICFLLSTPQREPQRYSYQVWGVVVDEKSRPVPKLTVCFIPSERPVNGRIPCVKASDDGAYALTVREVPDKYQICASTTGSPFLLAGDPDPTHRVTCSKPMEFGPSDECRQVNLKFEGKRVPR